MNGYTSVGQSPWARSGLGMQQEEDAAYALRTGRRPGGATPAAPSAPMPPAGGYRPGVMPRNAGARQNPRAQALRDILARYGTGGLQLG